MNCEVWRIIVFAFTVETILNNCSWENIISRRNESPSTLTLQKGRTLESFSLHKLLPVLQITESLMFWGYITNSLWAVICWFQRFLDLEIGTGTFGSQEKAITHVQFGSRFTFFIQLSMLLNYCTSSGVCKLALFFRDLTQVALRLFSFRESVFSRIFTDMGIVWKGVSFCPPGYLLLRFKLAIGLCSSSDKERGFLECRGSCWCYLFMPGLSI